MPRSRSFLLLTALCAATLPFTTSASAAPGTYQRPDGLYEVVLANGTRLLTHGPEPRTPEWMDSVVPTGTRASHGTTMEQGDPERAPVCATDFYQHVLYTRPGGALSRLATSKASIQAAIRRANHVLNEDALASGNKTADFKVLCDATGQIQVNEFISAGVDFSSVVLAASLAGFNKSNVDYTIFVDAPYIYCGQGSFASDDRLIVGNSNNTGGDYGLTWSGCWYGRTPMHENGHNQGAVQYNAPNSTGSGAHCNDQIDVMCYSDGGDKDVGDFTACSDAIHYDCRWDTYFDTAPEAGEWLATHWNIGSTLNRFIRFG